MSWVDKSSRNLFSVCIDTEMDVVGINDEKMYAFVIATSKRNQNMYILIVFHAF